ncbi:cellulose-binding protein [Streptomyces lunaelactis]|uniref:Cellulose-binding protein n=1 Tax=Streptomyces lunaelactis TaxID=1535768 RepID=A0A2R4T2U4_9ACTN|nr:cellulose-binding protein [Streptomyces lunaelactis]AVZ73469.1 cellulose-binding protein [Streptomyces lunaelactis]NUK89575.1 cellulose-binding protein [Streptomyces lunaelactis]
MSAASVSPHGFAAVRGRGYRVEETDAYVAALSQDRDDAWERAARLTVLAREMEAEADELRGVVSALAPQTYESLGRRAQTVLALTEEESEELRTAARDEAQGLRDAAEAAARQVREEAREYADGVRADAEARAQHVSLTAQTTADETRIDARREVKEQRGEAVAAWKEMRRRAEVMLAGLEDGQAERWDAVEREIAYQEAELDTRLAELGVSAEGALSDAKRTFAAAEEHARHGQEDAEARAAELIAEARVREERIERDTEQVLREHDEARDEMDAHMAHIRSSLTTLTGRAAAEG